MVTFGQIEEMMKKLDKSIEDVRVKPIQDFYEGNITANKKGRLKISLGFNHKEISRVGGIPQKHEDWIYRPFLLFVKWKKQVGKTKKKMGGE